jgi:hypothetical protein
VSINMCEPGGPHSFLTGPRCDCGATEQPAIMSKAALDGLLAALADANARADRLEALLLASEGVLVDAPALAVRERERADRLAVALEDQTAFVQRLLGGVVSDSLVKQLGRLQHDQRGAEILAAAREMAEALEWVRATHQPPSRQIRHALDRWRTLGPAGRPTTGPLPRGVVGEE